MAIEQPFPHSSFKSHILPGPIINGEPSALHLLGRSELSQSPLLVPLCDLYNLAFGEAHASHPPWIPSTVRRFEHPSDIINELGPDDFIIYIITSVPAPQPAHDGEPLLPKVYATSSVRRYRHKADTSHLDDIQRAFLRLQFAPDDKLDDWELKVLAVDPSIQKQGLASRLLALTEAEIVRRVQEEALQQASVGAQGTGVGEAGETGRDGKRIRLQLSAIKSINFEFYKNRGYTLCEERWYPKGLLMAKEDFAMVWLDKIVEVGA